MKIGEEGFERMEAEKQRVEEIHLNADFDMTGRPTNEYYKEDKLQKSALAGDSDQER